VSMIDWTDIYAAIWRSHRETLHGIHDIDPISLASLVGIDRQKELLINNTKRLIDSLPANNALLWGSRGTGKSSLIKAIFNEFCSQGLRIIEVDKNDMIYLADLVDDIRDEKFKFIIYCDDLSFENSETSYKSLKRVLDGSIEAPPKNVLVYATSNRRHLMPEYMRDNRETQLIDDELHYSDAVEEKIALSDRFGLWISFYPISIDDYLKIVLAYFNGVEIDKKALLAAATEFASLRGTHSGRTAYQFYRSYLQTKS